jgi:glycosyltransferase involved in cell wall biosynthesis
MRLSDWIDNPECVNLEIIVVQDCLDFLGGTEIRNLVEGKRKKNVKYIEGNYGNPGNARNIGLASATSEWVTFWDSDDLPQTKKFLLALDEAKKNESVILISSFQIRNDADNSLIKTQYVNSQGELLYDLALNPGLWRFAFNIRQINAGRFPSSSMGEDQAFIASMSIFEREVYLSKEVVYEYFTGASGHLTNNRDLMRDMKISLRDLRQLARTQKDDSRNLTYLFVIKQTLSCLKKGNLFLKIWAIAWIVFHLFRNPTKSLKGIILFLFKEER